MGQGERDFVEICLGNTWISPSLRRYILPSHIIQSLSKLNSFYPRCWLFNSFISVIVSIWLYICPDYFHNIVNDIMTPFHNTKILPSSSTTIPWLLVMPLSLMISMIRLTAGFSPWNMPPQDSASEQTSSDCSGLMTLIASPREVLLK